MLDVKCRRTTAATKLAMVYRPEVDGLRAFAVIPVILFHAGFDHFSGGFVGVDVFFVISGYLITNIIYKEMEQGRFSIMRFYERRARRILPALFLVCVACIPFAWFWMLPGEFRDFSKSLFGVATFTSNFLFWRESGYFADPSELKPLLHTWSLAVEEQFYILYPPILLLLYRLVPERLLFIIGLGVLASYSGPRNQDNGLR
ncbi:MAG: acyltransferase [Pseudohongiellaceae bacterium]